MTVEKIRKRDTSITINGHVIDLHLPVMEALEADGLVIISLNDYRLPPNDPLNGRNVVAFNQDGNEVWRIEDFWHKVEAKDGRKVPDSYTGIQLGDDGKLYAFQGIGYICEIDLKTGKILNEEHTR